MAVLPTFSALGRAFACPASCVLPTAQEESPLATEGTIRHRFVHRVSDLARSGMGLAEARALALAGAPAQARLALALIPVDQLRLRDVVTEVAFAIDATTGVARVLGRGLERRYDEAGRRPTEFCGSVDRIARIGQDGVYVGDLKGRSHDRRPDQDEQLLAGAYAACLVADRRWAELEIIRMVNSRPIPMKVRVARPDLERFGKRLQDLAGRIQRDRTAFEAGAMPECKTGEACRYCPSLRFCPAKGALLRAACGEPLPAILRLAKERKAYLTRENAPAIQARVAELEKLVRLMKADLADLARQAPFRRADGRMYAGTARPRASPRRARGAMAG